MKRPKICYPFGQYPSDWAVDPPPSSAVALWAVLQQFAMGNARCYPSQQTISTITGMDVSSIRRAASWLKERGYITFKAGSGRVSSEFRFTWHPHMPPKRLIKQLESTGAWEITIAEKTPVKNEGAPPANLTGEDRVIEDRVVNELVTEVVPTSSTNSLKAKNGTKVLGKLVGKEKLERIVDLQRTAVEATSSLQGSGVARAKKINSASRWKNAQRLTDFLSDDENADMGETLDERVYTFWLWACSWPHYRGVNERGWTANFDRLCQEKFITDIIQRGDPSKQLAVDDTYFERERLARVKADCRSVIQRMFSSCRRQGISPISKSSELFAELDKILKANNASVLKPSLQHMIQEIKEGMTV